MSICLPVGQSIYPSVCLSIYLLVCLSACLPVCLPLYQFLLLYIALSFLFTSAYQWHLNRRWPVATVLARRSRLPSTDWSPEGMYIQPNITHFTILFTFIAFSDSFSIFLFSYRDASFFLLFYIVLILFFHSTDFDEFPSFTLLSSPLIPLLNSFFPVVFFVFLRPLLSLFNAH